MAQIKRNKSINAHISNIESAKAFFADLLSDRQSHFDEKSEKWQESDAGQEYVEQHNVLEDLDNNLDFALMNLEDIFEND